MNELPVSLSDALHALVHDKTIRGRLPKSVQSRIEKAYQKEQQASECRAAVFEANEAGKDFDRRAKRIEVQRAVEGSPDEWSEYLFEHDVGFLVARKAAFTAAAEACRRDLAAEVSYDDIYSHLARAWDKHVLFDRPDTMTVGELKEKQAESDRLRPLILRINHVVADAVFGDIPDGGTLALRKADELLDARSLFIHAEAPQDEADAPDQEEGE